MLDTIIAQEGAFKLKGRLFTITVLQLLQYDLTQINMQLHILTQKAPRLFQHAPIIIDLHQQAITHDHLTALCELMRKYSMIPIGVQATDAVQLAAAQQCGLAVFSSSKDSKQDLPISQTPAIKAMPSSPSATLSKVITSPVRSGQQIYAEGSDLIVLASVSYGSELLADGHIHVYGTLRGRALAGIKGNQQARIFCKQLDADLVSIAGTYMVHDAIKQFKTNSACQIYLEGNKLAISAL